MLEAAQTELADLFQQAGADLIEGGAPAVLAGAGWRGRPRCFTAWATFGSTWKRWTPPF